MAQLAGRYRQLDFAEAVIGSNRRQPKSLGLNGRNRQGLASIDDRPWGNHSDAHDWRMREWIILVHSELGGGLRHIERDSWQRLEFPRPRRCAELERRQCHKQEAGRQSATRS